VRASPGPDRRRPPLSPVASTDQVAVALHDLGTDGGTPVLLAHATGFHGMVWAPLAHHLTGYHAVAPDLRGHGDTPPPVGRGQDWNGFVDDVLAVIDAWGVAPLFAVGHSKGGAALLLAEQRRPGTFRALYCYEPVVMPTEGFPSGAGASGNPLSAAARKRRERFDSFQDAYDNFASKPPLSSLDPEALHAYVDFGFAPEADGSVRLKCRPEIEAQTYEMAAYHDAFRHLGEVRCPVTIAKGGSGEFGPAAFAEAVAAGLPEGRIATFDDLGHFGPLEDPARIAASILEAFDGVD
jgi:pimeloyl-ACP methyl ester carboxylesterase